LQEAGAVFGEKNGWERVNYLHPGKPWRQAGADQKGWGWGRPDFFEAVAGEVKTAREKTALIDMTSFGKIDVSGPGALALLQRLAVGNLDKPAGSITYTQFLNEKGGIESDVTVTRMTHDRFRIISGTSFVHNELGWIKMHLPEDGSVEVSDVTEDWGCLALCGPGAREVLASVTQDKVSNEAFPYMTAQEIDIEGARIWAQRISYAGELGWELYIPWDDGLTVWDALMKGGKPFGLEPIGYKALDSMRIEKGFLYWSGDITPDDNPYEAGLGFCVDLDKGDFIGKQALIKIKEAGITSKLCAITLDADYGLFGGESVWVGDRLIDRIRSAAHGHTIGKDIGLVYLPPDLSRPGTEVEVEVLGQRIKSEVVSTPLFDPKGERLRA
jgi:4-methylaminobutanoate oxidase (formaldehyde-forming)